MKNRWKRRLRATKVKDLYKQYIHDETDTPDEEFNDYMKKVKYIITHKLTSIEQRILLIYAEYERLEDLAAKLHCSPSYCHYLIKDIRNKIITELKKEKYNDIP